MPFIVCDECGTKNELHGSAEPGGGAENSYVYCRACASRIELQAERGAANTSATESSAPDALLDELLSMPLAAAHPAADAVEPAPAVAETTAETAPAEAKIAASPETAPAEAEVAATPESAAPEQLAEAVPVAVPRPIATAVPRPSTAPAALGIEPSQKRSQPPPLPVTESAAEPAIASAPSMTESAMRAMGGGTPTRESMDELSWELPSPTPPVARELERSASDASAGLQELGEPLVAAPSVAVEGPPGSEASHAARKSAEEMPQVALETSLANIRATLPFGPTLALETGPGVVTDTRIEPDEPDATHAVAASAEPVTARAASVSAVGATSVTPTAEPARVEPAQLRGAAISAQAAQPTPAVLSLPLSAASVRTTSDAPTTQSWLPPEPSPSKQRRYAPLAAALVAIAVAFVGGIQVGKRSASSSASRAAAAAQPPAPRPAAAQVAAPPTATAVPASAGTPMQTDPNATPETKASHTDLVALKPSGKFSAKVANAALGQVSGRARACKKAGSPGGTALAMVTFGPSGRVEDVIVSGARFAGTPVATCIASALSAARVPPFAGSAQTVKRAVKID